MEEYPVQFEGSVCWIHDHFLRMVGLPLGVYAVSDAFQGGARSELGLQVARN